MRILNNTEVAGQVRFPRVGALLLRIGVTAALLFAIFHAVEIESALDALWGVSLPLLGLALVFQAASMLVASLRWHLTMSRLGFPLTRAYCLRSYFKGSFFNQGLPTTIGGDAMRVLDVAAAGYRKRDALAGVMVDRGLGLVALLLLNVLANLWNPGLLPREVYLGINLLAFSGLGGFVLFLLLSRCDFLPGWAPLRAIRALSSHAVAALRGGRTLALQTGLSLLVHVLAMLALFSIGNGVGLAYGLAIFMVLVPPVMLLTLIPISLAGWGLREGGMIELFRLIGAEPGPVLAMSLLYGVILIVSSLPGLYVFLRSRGVRSR